MTKKRTAPARGKGKAAPTIEQRMKLMVRQHGELLEVQRDTIAQVGGALERIGKLELMGQAVADAKGSEIERTLQVHAAARRARLEGSGAYLEVDEPAPRLPWWRRMFKTSARGAAQAG